MNSFVLTLIGFVRSFCKQQLISDIQLHAAHLVINCFEHNSFNVIKTLLPAVRKRQPGVDAYTIEVRSEGIGLFMCSLWYANNSSCWSYMAIRAAHVLILEASALSSCQDIVHTLEIQKQHLLNE